MTNRILLVDDDEVWLYTTAKVLKAAGYEVIAEKDFGPVLGHLESDQPFDLLLTDLVMPNGINGVALARMARLRRKDIKIVYISGFDIPADHRDVDMTILRKPVTDEELVAALKAKLAG